ncbi:MAG: hypothetical protein ACI9HK_003912 [Pirellulaceae bacterium]|jgi:hypothetical protein
MGRIERPTSLLRINKSDIVFPCWDRIPPSEISVDLVSTGSIDKMMDLLDLCFRTSGTEGDLKLSVLTSLLRGLVFQTSSPSNLNCAQYGTANVNLEKYERA